jgi:hypothetical protein
MARGLARTSLMTQVSVINGMMRAHDWLNSAEGQAWYSQNAELIGLFEYITPVASLNEVFQSLLPGHDHSLGNFGELGGLPFGWIPQLLDSEGLTHFNQPGVNASTGAVYTKYMPQTARGQLAVAIQDFLTSIFSYPGATVGLLPKSEITGQAASFLTTGSLEGAVRSGDLARVAPDQSQLSQQQQNFIDTISNTSAASASSQAPPQLSNQPPNETVNVPATGPLSKPASSSRGSGSGSRARKKKKAEFKPQLPPGQTTYGQL